MVGSAGGPLHQVHLLQVLAVGKRLVADEEVEVAVGSIAHGVAVLEIDAPHPRHIAEAVVGNAAQMRMVCDEAHQVVEDIHLTTRREVVGIDAGSCNVGFLGIDEPALAVGVPAVVFGLVDVGVEVAGVVVHGDVGVLHALVGVRIVAGWCQLRYTLWLDCLAVA